MNVAIISHHKNNFIKSLTADARHQQILLQFSFLLYGIIFLNWIERIDFFILTAITCLIVQATAIYFTNKNYTGLKSAFISSLSLCLMLKTNTYDTIIIASILSIGSKYVIRYKGKHIFNPTNFGIIITILITGDAWLSPGQWGNDLLLIAMLLIGGSSILFKVGRMDSSLTFISVFTLLNFDRMVIYQGWEMDVLTHHLSSGTLLLFTFFMITDPKSAPNARWGRIFWAGTIAIISFFMTSWFYVYAAPLWALFIMSPFTPLFDKWFSAKRYEWIQ